MKIETLSLGPHGKLKERWLVFVLQPKRASVRSGRWGSLCKHSPFSRLKWLCCPYHAAVIRSKQKKGLWASRYLVRHVFIQKQPCPLGYLCLCKGGDGRAGGGRLLPAPRCSVGRAGSACLGHQAGELGHSYKVVRWRQWLGFRGSEWPEVCLRLVVELFLATSLPSVWELSQPRCWALAGEQAHPAAEILPVAKELHVLHKTVHKKHFLR